MKKNTFLILLIVSIFVLGSCGVNTALILNHNQNNTQVHLGSNNYKVIEKVTGSAEVEYVFMIGGVDQRQLFEAAYSNMLSKAKLENTSKAVINVLTEEHVGGFPPFYYKRTITVSGYVIEFTR